MGLQNLETLRPLVAPSPYNCHVVLIENLQMLLHAVAKLP